MKSLIAVIASVVALIAGACGFMNIESGHDGGDLETLRKAIDDEIGKARADRLNQCRTIAFGRKPCGGPWEYLVYSIAETDPLTLRGLVSRYNRLEGEINESEGRVSDCMYVMRPDTALVGSRCIRKP